MFLKSLIFHQKVLNANSALHTNFPIGSRQRDVTAYLRPPRRMAPLDREEPPRCDFNRGRLRVWPPKRKPDEADEVGENCGQESGADEEGGKEEAG
jgi:hypothetical protein